MRLGIKLLVIFFTFFTASLAYGGTAVLGFEIGSTTLEQLKQDLSKKTKVKVAGINYYTAGETIRTAGDGYEIDGLNSVTYIFDDKKKLGAVIMSMSKHRFDAVFQFLNGKYKVVGQQRPFVGNQYARFAPADTLIEIDAPHLSFEMEVRYVRNDLMQKFKAQSEAEAISKKKSEASKF